MEIVIEPHIDTSKADKTATDEDEFNVLENDSSLLIEETPPADQMEEENFVKMER